MFKTDDETERLIKRAEECRALAGIVTNQEATQSYRELAESFAALAEKERRLSVLLRIRAELLAQSSRPAE